MKTATIDSTLGQFGTLYIDGDGQELNHDAVMTDDGQHYHAYTDDYRIVWETTDAWRAQSEAYGDQLREWEEGRFDGPVPSPGFLDDESVACDWEEYTVYDHSGNQVAFSPAAINPWF